MPLAPSSRAAKVAVVAALAAGVPLVSAETATSRPRRALLQTAAEIGAAVEDAAYTVGDAVTDVYDAVVDVVEAPAEAPMPDVGRRRALLDMHEFPPVEEEEDWSAMPTSMPMPPAEAPAMPDIGRRRALLNDDATYDATMLMPPTEEDASMMMMPPAEAPAMPDYRRRALLQDAMLEGAVVDATTTMPPAEEDASMMMMPPAEAPAMPDYRRRALLDDGAMYDATMPMPPAEAPMPDAARRRALLQDDYLDYVALGAAAPAPAPAA